MSGIFTEQINNENHPGFFSNIWLGFKQDKKAFAALIFIILLTLGAFGSDLLSRYDPFAHGDIVTERYLEPSADHLFGTDKFGRDIFSRVLYGGRISLLIAFSVVFLSMTIGLIYGTLSGYIGGRTDRVMMRLLDFLLAFPAIFLIITIIAVFRVSHWYLIPLLALTGWMETARLARAEALSIRERDFISAARGMGFSNFRILFIHVLPNCLTPLFALIPLKIAQVILLESSLSFLGIGVQPPTPSWGNIINDGREALLGAWWVSTFPGIFITLTAVSFNLLGEALRQKLRTPAGN